MEREIAATDETARADWLEWNRVGSQEAPSWYLDPVVAGQKRAVHQELIRRWARGRLGKRPRVLKTDLFEEAYGRDQILFDTFPDAVPIGIDLAWKIVRRARHACPAAHIRFVATDARFLAFKTGSIDLIVSTSTLDHFESAADLDTALKELARVLSPGGLAIVTLDNPRNPFYSLLRFAARRGWVPFRLGYTASQSDLVRRLEAAGLEVTATDVLIHNPRGVSTLLFLGLRRLLGVRADGPIRAALKVFALLGRLPTRRFTACFTAACARKPQVSS